MAPSSRGQTDTFTKTLYVRMEIGTSRISYCIRLFCRRRASPSCSTVSKAKRCVQNSLHRTSTFSRRLLSATTVSCSPKILNEESVSVVHRLVSPLLVLKPWRRSGGDRRHRALQGPGQEHPEIIETGKLVGSHGGLSGTIPGTSWCQSHVRVR
jgi:hypothetical protein